jgi:hypothetical protein
MNKHKGKLEPYFYQINKNCISNFELLPQDFFFQRLQDRKLLTQKISLQNWVVLT